MVVAKSLLKSALIKGKEKKRTEMVEGWFGLVWGFVAVSGVGQSRDEGRTEGVAKTGKMWSS